jgi:hypothetical protein
VTQGEQFTLGTEKHVLLGRNAIDAKTVNWHPGNDFTSGLLTDAWH